MFRKKLTKVSCFIFLSIMLFCYNNCTQGFHSNSTSDALSELSSEDGTFLNNNTLIKAPNCSVATAYDARNKLLTRISKDYLRFSVLDITGVDIQAWEEYQLLPTDYKSIKGLSNDSLMQSHKASDVADYSKLFSRLAKTVLTNKNGPIFTCENWTNSAECMNQLVERIFNLAHKGDPSQELLVAIKSNYNKFDSRDDALEFTLYSALMSPEFLYHLDALTYTGTNAKSYLVANRLASLLWSTSPDQTLLSLVKEGSLLDKNVLIGQIDRMLKDDKFSRFYEVFVGGWLSLSNAKKNFDNEGSKNINLINSLLNEPKQIFKYIVENNLPINDLLVGDYTILDDNLASYYGLSSVSNNTKSVNDKNRLGVLLTPASLAGNGVITHQATDTNPTHRGYNILKKYFCLPPDPLPPSLEDVVGNFKDSFAQHSSKKEALASLQVGTCGGCHKQTDSVGLALENYDSFGNFRTVENGVTIDPSGELATGAQFQDALGMIVQFDKSAVYDFENCLTHSLVSYAKKITLSRDNLCVTKEIPVNKSMSFTELITEIALSDEFSR